MWPQILALTVVVIVVTVLSVIFYKRGQEYDYKIRAFSAFSGDDLTIGCDEGEKINIIGAYHDPYDPHGQCGKPEFVSPALKEQCRLNPDYPPCKGVDENFVNTACRDNCVMRDVSGVIAEQCDGSGTCRITNFGAPPCKSAAARSGSNVDIYSESAEFPTIMGILGSKQGGWCKGGDCPINVPQTLNKKSHLHGIYTCRKTV